MKSFSWSSLLILGASLLITPSSYAQSDPCAGLPTHAQVRDALITARNADNGGFGLHMWATVVNRDGLVCVVAFSGNNRGDQWPGSRVISAQKANTANAFSLPGLALSTANLFSAVQPGQSLFGLSDSNPVDPQVAYGGDPATYGQTDDPMVGKRIGGINTFGGGLALYNSDGALVGGLGVSGDTSCTDHIIAWRVRDALALDRVPGGVNQGTDNILHDVTVDRATGQTSSISGFGHPTCDPKAASIAQQLPALNPITR
ncbi:MAG: heme-binding protein [Candidatus Binatia bacterium]